MLFSLAYQFQFSVKPLSTGGRGWRGPKKHSDNKTTRSKCEDSLFFNFHSTSNPDDTFCAHRCPVDCLQTGSRQQKAWYISNRHRSFEWSLDKVCFWPATKALDLTNEGMAFGIPVNVDESVVFHEFIERQGCYAVVSEIRRVA